MELLTQRQDELQRQHKLGIQAAQIIMTTHSPYLIDQVALDDLIVRAFSLKDYYDQTVPDSTAIIKSSAMNH
jgi:hypothetical protein